MRKAREGSLRFHPRAETPLEPGDVLMLMGERAQVDVFQESLADKAVA